MLKGKRCTEREFWKSAKGLPLAFNRIVIHALLEIIKYGIQILPGRRPDYIGHTGKPSQFIDN